MKLDIIYGHSRNPEINQDIVDLVNSAFSDGDLYGTLFFGYPILIKTHTGDKIVLDALLITSKHGVIAFTESNLSIEVIQDAQDEIYNKLQSKLIEFKFLTKNRTLIPSIEVVTFCSGQIDNIPITSEKLVHEPCDFSSIIENSLTNIENNLNVYNQVNSVIESLVSFKDRKSRDVTDTKTLGWAMNQIEKEIANLDREQKRAAIEDANGPQRIRGLAGSGKTIVLALKAAYLHVQNPDKKICITFNTRSLKEQFIDLVTRFTFEHIKDKPNWEMIDIIHAWGSNASKGVYSHIAKVYKKEILDFSQAAHRFGYEDAFSGCCNKLLSEVILEPQVKIYDIVLIDEAQDLPRSFFELIIKVVSDNKHIIWAYDELQTIGKYTIDSPEILFGNNSSGIANISSNDLVNESKKPTKDFILKKCYRNPPWVLSLAHALGFGLYKSTGPIQAFDYPQFWNDIGYSVVSGTLDFGGDVVLERDRENIPDFFNKFINKNHSVVYKTFGDVDQQYSFVVDSIIRNINEDKMSPHDILVINANPIYTKRDTAKLRMMLNENGIDNHLAGVTSSVDQFFIDGKVTISGIFRAKGNEAPIVYIVNSDYCFDANNNDIVMRRNILFTAITRTRAHINIFGCGGGMSALVEEIDRVVQNDYKLTFKYPTVKELEDMRVLYRNYDKNTIATKDAVSKLLDIGKADVLKTLSKEDKQALIELLSQ
ncbi:MAG: RNA helicase [Neisseriaceae bacterium]|nr:MAG: RNA helicase [Neisseriaceae bacterium]